MALRCSLNGVYWTLRVEEQLYLATPRWLAAASRLGLMSYSLYLVHEIPDQLMNRFHLEKVGPPAITMTVLLLVELAFAALFCVLAERPFLNSFPRMRVTQPALAEG